MRKHLYLILLLALVSSCLSLEKALKKTTENEASAGVALITIKNKYPLTAAKWAASAYPTVPKTTVVRDTVKQEIIIKGDSIQCPPVNTSWFKYPPVVYKPAKPTYVKCPDISYYTSTISEQISTIEENTAALEAKDLELAQKDKEIHDREQEVIAEKEAHAATVEEMKPYKWTVWVFFVLAFLLILWMAFKRVVIAYIKTINPF